MLLLASEFLNLAKFHPVIDVRTPAEFELGHIPGAFNIPLFSNEERAIVGTIYKNTGKEAAVYKGLELVGPKLSQFVSQAKEISEANELLVYCWRGGMRSQSMAWLMNTAGFRAHTLSGGYKGFRRHIRTSFYQGSNLIVLGGYTGSGKTYILNEISKLGNQIIDLEQIAHHKGSAFGHIGQAAQPSTEQFENLLGLQWLAQNSEDMVWVEDESKAIGRVFQPEPFYIKLRNAPVIFIDMPVERRIKHLVDDYAGIDHQALEDSLGRIVKRLGGNNYQEALLALAEKDYATVARISLNYYDKAYLYGVGQRNPNLVHRIEVSEESYSQIAVKILEYVQNQKIS